MRFSFRLIRLFFTDPLCYQIRLERRLDIIYRKIITAENEYLQESLLIELNNLLTGEMGAILSEKKLCESLERSGIKNLVKTLLTTVSKNRISFSNDNFIQNLRQANQWMYSRAH